MIIFDNHLHLRRDGQYLEAVKDFIRAGGTHFVLCQYPMVHQVIKDKTYKNVFQQTVDMAEEIQQQLDITVYTTVGPYPVDYLRLKEKLGGEKAIELMKKGMEIAAQFCLDGKSIGIGEIGRPHFPVDQEIMEESNKILSYGMKQAKQVDVPVILHTESTTPTQCKELVEMGKKVGLSADKIVKHFSPPFILPEENSGLMPSVLANKKNIRKAIKKGTRFMMETDYIDDPKRPGAVLGPKTVPRRTFELLEKELASKEDLIKIHKENPEKTYGIQLVE
ncbi:MAG: TatD family hydrolase [Candidatus Thermoplasmatota archaeon]|nr:TatD family hydrolase [Candidatus Thermoplasmatota archaeon]MBS3802102.1 TatD family hydrolase [Candidatus Thermoplasmatota archaeon]